MQANIGKHSRLIIRRLALFGSPRWLPTVGTLQALPLPPALRLCRPDSALTLNLPSLRWWVGLATPLLRTVL